jgi:hypothetical protein
MSGYRCPVTADLLSRSSRLRGNDSRPRSNGVVHRLEVLPSLNPQRLFS